MYTQTFEKPTEIDTDRAAYEQYIDGLAQVAQAVMANPRQRKILDYYLEDDGEAIHHRLGGERTDGNLDFWQNHGTFVAPDGAIYRVRSDDWRLQVYVSPVDERATSVDCIRPYTYDGHIGPYSIEMRADFINGAHRTVPKNTPIQHELQRREFGDGAVLVPRHIDGMWFSDERRDSIALRKYPDGHIEGWLHDGADGSVVRMYPPAEVRSMIEILADEAQYLEEIDNQLISMAL